jgi:ribose transport system ATP-binding protein
MYQLIGELAAQGKTVLFVSSYLSELLGVCDRISVMHRGILSPPMDTDGLDEHRVMSIATGVG